MKKIVIYGGGTFNHIRSHMAIAAPSFGTTAQVLTEMLVATGHTVETKAHRSTGEQSHTRSRRANNRH